MACPEGTFPPDLDLDCGFVRVPENWSDPNGRTITVAAAVIRSSAAHPRQDPIVFLDGGPSFGAIAGFAPTWVFNGDYYGDRDVILVDTRGTGIAKPRLGCPELDRAEVRAFYSGRSINSRALPIYRQALAHCRDRLTAKGIDLAAFTSAESAADLESLRRALGVHRWNLLAFSADGVLALTYMRLYPQSLRSVILDSAQSTQMLWGLDYDRGYAAQLDAIFAGCAADPDCHAAYPGIRRSFFRMVHRLHAHPATITFPRYRPTPVQLHLDGGGLYADAIYSIYPGDKFSPSEIPDLLERIWRETHGELVQVYREWFGRGPTENGHANDFVAQGKSLSYLCHDVVNFITRADRRQAAEDLPPFAARYLARGFDLRFGSNSFISPAGCHVWQVGRAAAVQHEPVTSSIPTLVLAGEYDGGVTPNIVRQTTVGLSRSHYYEIPAGAHGQLAGYNVGSECARSIAGQFLGNPALTPDSSCISSLPGVDFSP
jgi:pimeloyl-ACP methyl ester carboxylesterase